MSKLTESYFYLDDTEHRREFCVRMGIKAELPAWLPQRLISRTLFGKQGEIAVRRCEKNYGNFLWAPEFSNVHTRFEFAESPIIVDGVEYACTEAFYQSRKSVGLSGHEESRESIRMLGPTQAFSRGQSCLLRPDWQQHKRGAMTDAVHAKFTQNEKLRHLLLSTKDAPLVQIKPADSYWGTGLDCNGENMLGQLLQELRKTLS